MKQLKLLFIVAIFLATSVKLSAQISEDEKSMSMGVKNALVLQIPEAKQKFVKKLWKKYLKQFKGKTKRVKKADEMRTSGARIVEIGGSSEVDLVSRVSGTGGGDVELIMWVNMDGDEFLSSYNHPDRYTEAEKILMRFGLEVTREKIKIELKDEENRLKKYNKDHKKLKRNNANYHREITIAQEKIKKAEANIVQNEIEQETMRATIESQKDLIEEVKKRLSEI